MRRSAGSRLRGLRSPTLGVVFILWPLCHGSPAQAQLGLSASLDSDYRFRGLSLSDERPTLSVNLSYDDASGAYAGASAIGVDTAHSGVQFLGSVTYLGYARRGHGGLAWDVGLSNTNVTEYRRYKYSYDYTEAYAGIIGDHLAAHVYYSPNYRGDDYSTLYADLDGAVRPAPQWRLFGHVGVLTPLSGRPDAVDRHERYDFRAGVATQFKHLDLHLAWTVATPAPAYPPEPDGGRGAVVVGATYYF